MAKKKSAKKTVKKIGNTKQTCGKCVFYVENQDKKGVGSCFQVTGVIKPNQSPACKGKFFKQRA
jgi:hypothetical protein